MKGWKRAALALTGGAAFFIALGGFAHTPAGRPLLALFGKCPVALPGSLTPADREDGRAIAIRSLRGTAPASARPALAFSLGTTRHGDIDAWAREHALSCQASPSGSTLTCKDVPAALLPEGYRGPAVNELTFRFDAKESLVAVVTRRGTLAAPVAWETQRAIAKAVESAAGAPSSQVGDASTLTGTGAFAQVRTEFRFRDYYATCTASRIQGNVTLYEEYMLIPD